MSISEKELSRQMDVVARKILPRKPIPRGNINKPGFDSKGKRIKTVAEFRKTKFTAPGRVPKRINATFLKKRNVLLSRLQKLSRAVDPSDTDPLERARFDEQFSDIQSDPLKEVAPVRVETFSKFPESKRITKRDKIYNEPIDVPMNKAIGTTFGQGSPLGQKVEESRLNRELLKERGQAESFGEMFNRKFGVGRFQSPSLNNRLFTIKADAAKKFAKLQIRLADIQQPSRPRPDPITTFPKMKDVNINPRDGRVIADEFDKLKHEPNKPSVKAAYGALAKETNKQFLDLKKKGLKITKIEAGQSNPYPNSAAMHADLRKNNHLFYFPSEQGFGTSTKFNDHPLLKQSGLINDAGEKMVSNDVFRVVHDVNGHHLGEEASFGPRGEQQAFLTHKTQYSPLATKALFTETAGQNNWVNFSREFGEANRKNPANTIFADQKAGLFPNKIINRKFHI